MFSQWMAKPLRQNLELVQLSHGVLHHNAIFGEKTIIDLLFLSQWMVALSSCLNSTAFDDPARFHS